MLEYVLLLERVREVIESLLNINWLICELINKTNNLGSSDATTRNLSFGGVVKSQCL